MFGCCVAGRLLQTNLQQVDETHCLFTLENASTINHICLFLLGTVAFPEGYAGAVHFHWPGKGFQLLGMISNDKPSAIFRLKASYSSNVPHHAFSSANAISMAGSADVTAILGISIEPISDIEAQLSALPSSLTNSGLGLAKDPTLLAERIVKHFFNYISGFASSSGMAVTPQLSVPMRLIEKWYETFSNKVKNGGIGFLEQDV